MKKITSKIAYARTLGADCKNTGYAHSYVNHEDKLVIVPHWVGVDWSKAPKSVKQVDGMTLVYSSQWKCSDTTGHIKNSWKETMEHIRLVMEEGYDFYTYSMNHGGWVDGVSQTNGFNQDMKKCQLIKIGDNWYIKN